MKTQSILQNPVAKKMYDLKLKTSVSVLTGKCREANKAKKEFAKLAVDNFDTAIKLPQPVTGTFPWYSNFGLNTIKYMLFNLFVKKSPEEKKLKEMIDDYRSSLYDEICQ